MTTFSIPEIQLNSGYKMPVLGLGTATSASVKADDKKAVLQAIERGYRHFDTASLYGSKEALGEALWCSDAHADRVRPALQNTLRNLKLEYLDLYLVHWPISTKPGTYEYPMKKEDVLPFDCKSVWTAMEECHRLGLVKSIGVSNFTCKKIEDMLTFSRIPPAVNQVILLALFSYICYYCAFMGISNYRILTFFLTKFHGVSKVELNPCWQQKKLINLCKPKGIVVTSFSPLGAVGTAWGSNRVMENEVLKQIAKAKGKSVPQVCLRWAYQQGVAIVAKSYKPERMQENHDIFDWELSDEECKKISEIPQSKGHKGPLVSEDGPIKSIEELWDGEL
ncbi:hypothetical protein BUALT_Bualt17G0054200 [Buddleja alternifolia]|uniref:NADP-dependent oxidoreductase domain-containing protein n=1 Tax=Buddleja alternifolia TaxID=168488 RepID=A0AAV6W6B9_9LAMI|nr:hypothetical protein BUALT_Bualt17G0054200 [Buddleja alternifolia]